MRYCSSSSRYPENGYFSRDAAGIPTGMLNEAAMEFARTSPYPEPHEALEDVFVA